MALSDTSIRRFLTYGGLKIEPLDDSCINPAGYDLKCGVDMTVNPKSMILLSTLEFIRLPTNLLGVLHLRSSFAREGLIASLALVDPGFRGQLTVMLYNTGDDSVSIKKGEPFLQITFFKIAGGVNRGYSGVYQDSIGVVKSLRGKNE